jgi:HEAT repeat protein
MDLLEIEALFAQTLLGDYDGDEPWDAVHKLRSHGSREIFDRAAAWCESDEPLKRARAADILCQLYRERLPSESIAETEWMFRSESYALISKMLDCERLPMVLESAICGLGHLHDDRAVPLILRHRDHLDENVRFAVAVALGDFANEPESVLGLLKLVQDPDDDVRDWAVFGLGVLGDANSPEIREALLRCLDDPSEDVREEAAVGLGLRRDLRVIPMLKILLEEPELRMRTAEIVAGLLGMEDDRLVGWTVADCRSVLADKLNCRP